MNDSQVLETAPLFPHACIGCKGTLGPFIDMVTEDSNGLRVYLCRTCARGVARVFGFSQGKKLEELSNAAQRIGEVEEERDAEKKARDKSDSDVQLLTHALMEEKERTSYLRGRVAQLEAAVSEEAKAKLALVGGDAA